MQHSSFCIVQNYIKVILKEQMVLFQYISISRDILYYYIDINIYMNLKNKELSLQRNSLTQFFRTTILKDSFDFKQTTDFLDIY